MSQYLRGDDVRFVDPNMPNRIREGFIHEVLSDGDLVGEDGDIEESLYIVIDFDTHERFEVFDHHIEQLLEEEEDPIAEDPHENVVDDVDDVNPFAQEIIREAEIPLVWGNPQPAQNQPVQRHAEQIEEQGNVQQPQAPRVNWIAQLQEEQRQRFRRALDEVNERQREEVDRIFGDVPPQPAHVGMFAPGGIAVPPIPDNPPPIIVGDDNATEIVIGERHIPIVNETDFHDRLRTEDYIPTTENQRFMRFFVGMGRQPITPVLIAENGPIPQHIEFRDTNGRTWVNQYSHGAIVANSNLSPRDVFGSRWLREDTYTHLRAIQQQNAAAKAPKKPKKKLRRKYKSMPTIKDEKYYAGKEFIA